MSLGERDGGARGILAILDCLQLGRRWDGLRWRGGGSVGWGDDADGTVLREGERWREDSHVRTLSVRMDG